MGKSNKGSVMLIMIIFLALTVVVGLVFYTISDGIVEIVEEVFGKLGDTITNKTSAVMKQILHIPFKGDLKLYKIEETTVEALRLTLESSAVDTEACGLTKVRLKKMLMANAISTSFSSTLCISEVTEEEMLENLKSKQQYKDIKSVQEFLDNPYSKQDSDDLWPIEGHKYDLYYDSAKFFYFKDSDNMFSEKEGTEDDEGRWYLGAMGAITLEKADTDGEMVYATEETFQAKKAEFEEAVKNPLKGEDFQEEEMLKVYTDGDTSTSIKVWTLTTKQNLYEYEFQNKNINNGEPLKKQGEDDNYTYDIKEETINLEDKIDVSSMSISIELMLDLLNMTSSGEFLEVFIDYALSQTNAEVKVYQMTDIKTTYQKEEYNINPDFIIEAYDFIDTGESQLGDIGNDNFIAYSDIVYNRTYNGRPFETSVAELLKSNPIKMNGEEKTLVTLSAEELKNNIKQNTEIDLDEILSELQKNDEANNNEELTQQELSEYVKEKLGNAIQDVLENDVAKEALAKVFNTRSEILVESVGGIAEAIVGESEFTYMSNYHASPLEQYLKTAYDPGEGFDLGEVKVTEKTTIIKKEITYDAVQKSTQTWYADITYSEPNKKYIYSLAQGEDEISVEEKEYNEFNSDNLEIESTSTGEVQKVRISSNLKKQYEDKYNEMGEDVIVEESTYFEGGNDITSEELTREPGTDNKSYFENCTENGLFKIATVDKGKFNDKLTGGRGSDYLYVKYSKDIDEFEEATKTKRHYLDTSNVTKELADSTDSRLEGFLGLLKNEDGEIPSYGTTKQFKRNGKVVLYGDIYKGKAAAGDLLLDNGALMLFEILESSEATQNLVNVFKYLAYRYTGTDYGVTDIEQLKNILTFSGTYCSNPLLEYIKSWENSYIKNYIDGTGSYGVAQKYITQDKSKYIIYWEESSQTWNFSYGLNLTRRRI